MFHSTAGTFDGLLSLQAGPNLLLCPSAKSGVLWSVTGNSMVQLGKRTAGAQFGLDMQEEITESVSEQVCLYLHQICQHLSGRGTNCLFGNSSRRGK